MPSELQRHPWARHRTHKFWHRVPFLPPHVHPPHDPKREKEEEIKCYKDVCFPNGGTGTSAEGMEKEFAGLSNKRGGGEQSRTKNTHLKGLEFLLNVRRTWQYHSMLVGDVGKHKKTTTMRSTYATSLFKSCSWSSLYSYVKLNASWARPCVPGCSSTDVHQASAWFGVMVILHRGLAATTDNSRTRSSTGEERKRENRWKRGVRKREACSLHAAKINHSTKRSFVSDIQRK